MHSYLASLFLAAAASAATIDVTIGQGGLKYTPNSVTAAEGDVIRFMWSGGTTHNVASGSFSSPCQPDNMIASPKQSGGSMDFFVQINSTDPIFLYCSVFDHCNEGMVMAINPTSDQTLDMYSSGANGASIGQPSGVEGGILAASTATPFAAATGSPSGSPSSSGASPSAAATTSPSSSASPTGNAAALATGAPAVAVGAAAIGFAAMLI